MAQYLVSFNAGSTGATGLPSSQYKQEGKNLILPSTKPKRSSTTSGNYSYDYTFAYWEGTPQGGTNTTTSNSKTSSTNTWMRNYSTYFTNAREGITYQPGVRCTATRNASNLSILIEGFMNHVYGDCIGSGFWYSFDGGSTWQEQWEQNPEQGIHYQGDWTKCETTYTLSTPESTGYVILTVMPYRWQPKSYGKKTQGDGDVYETVNSLYIDLDAIDFKIIWNADGVQVLDPVPRGTYKNISYASRQYPAGGTYNIDAAITLFPVFTETKTLINTNSTITYNKNCSDTVSGMPSKQTKKKDATITLKLSTVPTREDYVFTGWFSDSSCTKKVSAASYSNNSNLILYAGWRKKDFIIEFNSGGYSNVKNLPSTQYKTKGTALTIPSTTPTIAAKTVGNYKYTYTFKHWVASQDIVTKSTTTTTVTTESTLNTDSVTKDWGVTPQWWLFNTSLGISVQPKIKVTATRTSSSNVKIVMDFTMIHTYGDCVGCGFWYSFDGGSTWAENTPVWTAATHLQGSITTLSTTLNIPTSSTGFINLVLQPCTWYYSSNRPTTNYWTNNGYNYCLFNKVYVKIPYITSALECCEPCSSFTSDNPKIKTTIKTSTSTTNVQYSPGDAYKAEQSTTMYAVFTETKTNVSTYSVSYNSNGGQTAIAAQTKTYGKNLTLSKTVPTRKNETSNGHTYKYTFKCWNTKSTGKGTTYQPGATYSDNAALTLYAQWTATDITPYTITYDVNGGQTAIASQTKVHGDKLTLSKTVPTRKNETSNGHTYKYTFKCWNTKSTGRGTTYNPGDTYTADANMTLYAQWTATDVTPYTITYDVNGGQTTIASQTKVHGDKLTLSKTVPTRKNETSKGHIYQFTFKGWNTKKDGTGTTYKPGDTYAADANVTLYAQWATLDITPYTITYDVNGGQTAIASQTKMNGVSLTLSKTVPTRFNETSGGHTYQFTFKCWNTKKDGKGTTYQPGSTYAVNADVILYAQWTSVDVTPWTITFNSNGGSVSKASQKVINNVASNIIATATAPNTTKTYSVEFRRKGYVGTTNCPYLATTPTSNQTKTFTNTTTWVQTGWNTKKDGTGTTYAINGSITCTNNLTLYAIYKVNNTTSKSITTPTRSTFTIANQAEDGYPITAISRCSTIPTKTYRTTNEISYKLNVWRAPTVSEFTRGQSITASSNVGWTQTSTKTGGPMGNNLQETYSAYLSPVWTRSVVTWGRVYLPKTLTWKGSDEFGLTYRFCGWTASSNASTKDGRVTVSDGYTDVVPMQPITVYAIWEPGRLEQTLISSKYLHDEKYWDSWWRLLKEITEQTTAETSPIRITTYEVAYRFPASYQQLVKGTDLCQSTSPKGIVDEIQAVVNSTDAQGRKWFLTNFADCLLDLDDEDFDEGKPITKKIRDSITQTLIKMRKLVRIY